MKVSLSELVDRLIILNLKIWHMEDSVRDPEKSNADVGSILRVMTRLNEQRTLIKAEIDGVYGDGVQDLKIYPTFAVKLPNHYGESASPTLKPATEESSKPQRRTRRKQKTSG